MGQICGSLTEEEKLNRQIQKQNELDRQTESKKLKLLLLGTGESGKSTIFKQVKMLYGDKYTKEELLEWKPRVYENINKQIFSLLRASQKLEIPLADEGLRSTFEYTLNDPTHPIDSKLAGKIKALWADSGLQKVWEQRAEYQVLECIEYYVEEIDRITSVGPEEYVPNFQDVVHARVRTTGIVQENFRMKDAPFEMYDVGGQRSERRKWLNCFDNVTTVIFVAAINEYDQVLFEDSKTDRIQEAINTWKDIVNREEFKNVGFVLFLNKFDLFKEKLPKYPFKVEGKDGRNQDFEGVDATKVGATDEAVQQASEYMERKFMSVANVRKGLGQIKVYLTTATDSNIMENVFNSCRDQILRINLMKSGFAPPRV